jgi:ELWxxDGT repeat protein
LELWKTDGTNAGTVLVKDIYSGSIGSSPQFFVTSGDTAYFQANGGSTINTEIFKTNGTTDGTLLAADVEPGSFGSSPSELVIIGNKLVFVATTPTTGREIFMMPLSSAPALVTWTGDVSTVWEDPANWQPGVLPGSTTEVIIPSGRPRYPTVAVNTQVKKLSCQSGATITVASGISFKVLQ